MSLFVVTLLVLPVVLAFGVVLRRRHAAFAARAGGLVLAACWSVVAIAASPDRLSPVAGAGVPIEVGEFRVDAIAAGAAAGVALLLAAFPPRSAVGTSGGLASVTVLATTATVGGGVLPDRRFALGVVVIAGLVLGRLAVEHAGRVALLGSAIGSLAVIAALGSSDASVAAALAVCGAAMLVVTPLLLGTWPSVLVPVALLAVERTTSATGVAELFGAGSERVAVLGVGVGGACALVQLLVRRRPAVERVPLAATSAALVLLAQDVGELHRAGVLLAAGGVLAIAGRHVVGLVACVPGLIAAVDAASIATEPVHAGAAAAVVAVLAAAAVEASGTPRHPGPVRWPLAPAVAFGVLPVAGFAQVDLATLGPTLLALVTVTASAGALALAPAVLATRHGTDETRR